MSRNFKDYALVSLKGIAMGAADVVPGVSGGTIAFISGIYEELIASINQVNLKNIKLLFSDGFAAAWKAMNGNFLLALVVGIGVSVLSLAKLIRYLLENEPVLIWSFFFGLVLASVFYVGKQIERWNLVAVVFFVLGAVLAYWITTLTPQEAEVSYPYVFLSGALAICAMILPGISGSFILLLLGMYKPVLDALHDKKIGMIAVLMAGAVVGLLSFSRLLKWLFDHYKNLTLAILTGFILGSLNKIWPWKQVVKSELINGKMKVLSEESVGPAAYDGDPKVMMAIGLALVGILVIVGLEMLAQRKPSGSNA